MNAVRDLQDEIRDQDDAMAKMTMSTRKWLLYFTFIEAAVLVGVTAWQNLCARRDHHIEQSSAGLAVSPILTSVRFVRSPHVPAYCTHRSHVFLRGQARGVDKARLCGGVNLKLATSTTVY